MPKIYRWMRRGVLQKVYAKLRGTYRHAVGGQAGAAQWWDHRQSDGQDDGKGGPTGFDGGKRGILVLPAHISDGEGGKQLLKPIHSTLSRMKKFWVDGGYKEGFQLWVEERMTCRCRLEQWTRTGVFRRRQNKLLEELGHLATDRLEPSRPRLQQHPGEKGGPATGPNPTDRAKRGTKHHIFRLCTVRAAILSLEETGLLQ